MIRRVVVGIALTVVMLTGLIAGPAQATVPSYTRAELRYYTYVINNDYAYSHGVNRKSIIRYGRTLCSAWRGGMSPYNTATIALERFSQNTVAVNHLGAAKYLCSGYYKRVTNALWDLGLIG